METITSTALASYPPAPQNGGPLESAPAKIGAWAWQPKIDDWRGVVNITTGQVWNQYGEVSTVARQNKIGCALENMYECLYNQRECEPLTGFELFDVGIMENRHDLMRGCIIVFDAMDSKMSHKERRKILEACFPVLPIAHVLLAGGQVRDQVYLIDEWRNEFDTLTPTTLQALLKRENELVGHKFYEGLVAKRMDVPYPVKTAPKQKTNLWVKHRFDQ